MGFFESLAVIAIAIQVILTAIALTPIFLGGVIIRRKTFREIGVYLILMAVVGVVEVNMSLVSSLVGIESAYPIVIGSNVAINLMIFAAMVMLFLYARRSYGAKGLPVVIGVLAVSEVLLVVIRWLLSALGENAIIIEMFLSRIGSFAEIGVMVFIAICYYKSKDSESSARLLWLFVTILACTGAMGIIMPYGIMTDIFSWAGYVVRIVFGGYLIKNSVRR